MKLLVGLGNPGSKYAGNRHNIGYMALEAIADAHHATPWRRAHQGRMAEARIGGAKVLMLCPETFMNLSGQAVGEAMRFYRLDPRAVTVFHDELDLAPGRLRVKIGGGHGGHNGLRSMAAHIGPDFARVRLGIGHPGDKRLVTPHVLGDFAKADRAWLDPLLDALARELPLLAAGDLQGYQQAVMRRIAPPPERPAAKLAAQAPPVASPERSGGQPRGPFAVLRALIRPDGAAKED